jgi:hypothetical protein
MQRLYRDATPAAKSRLSTAGAYATIGQSKSPAGRMRRCFAARFVARVFPNFCLHFKAKGKLL